MNYSVAKKNQKKKKIMKSQAHIYNLRAIKCTPNKAGPDRVCAGTPPSCAWYLSQCEFTHLSTTEKNHQLEQHNWNILQVEKEQDIMKVKHP